MTYPLRKNLFSVAPKENPQKHIYRHNNIEPQSKQSLIFKVNTFVCENKFYIIFSIHVYFKTKGYLV